MHEEVLHKLQRTFKKAVKCCPANCFFFGTTKKGSFPLPSSFEGEGGSFRSDYSQWGDLNISKGGGGKGELATFLPLSYVRVKVSLNFFPFPFSSYEI